VQAAGDSIYAGTAAGLSISRDGGSSWANLTAADGLGDSAILDVSIDGSTILAGTRNGLSISRDGGSTWKNYTAADGLGRDYITAVFVEGSAFYAGTNGGGLSISKDGGATWTTYSTGNTQQDGILDIYAKDSMVYAATAVGVIISEDGGASWKRHGKSDGLGDSEVHSIFAEGSTIYAGTYRGLSISRNGGKSWTTTLPHTVNKLAPDWHDTVACVWAGGSTVFAGGVDLAVSMDGGKTWKDFGEGDLGNASIAGIYVDESTLYLGTNAGIFVYRLG
jgi:photosystem II stability/assembly factor-like uncharacterized protein